MITEDKKELIRDHAIEVIARKGFQNTKIKDIAIESGIAAGTIYNYFKSKNEILDYIIITEFEKRVNVLKKMKENYDSFMVVITGIIDYHIEEIKQNPSLVKLIMKETFQIMEYNNETIRNIFNENEKLMTEIFVHAQKKGEISKNFDAKYIASSILYSLRCFAYDYVIEDNFDYDLVKLRKQLMQFYINGLT